VVDSDSNLSALKQLQKAVISNKQAALPEVRPEGEAFTSLHNLTTDYDRHVSTAVIAIFQGGSNYELFSRHQQLQDTLENLSENVVPAQRRVVEQYRRYIERLDQMDLLAQEVIRERLDQNRMGQNDG